MKQRSRVGTYSCHLWYGFITYESHFRTRISCWRISTHSMFQMAESESRSSGSIWISCRVHVDIFCSQRHGLWQCSQRIQLGTLSEGDASGSNSILCKQDSKRKAQIFPRYGALEPRSAQWYSLWICYALFSKQGHHWRQRGLVTNASSYIYVDDNMMANTRRRMWDTLAAGIKAIFNNLAGQQLTFVSVMDSASRISVWPSDGWWHKMIKISCEGLRMAYNNTNYWLPDGSWGGNTIKEASKVSPFHFDTSEGQLRWRRSYQLCYCSRRAQ